MKFAYFSGCSLHSTAKEFGDSTYAVCKALGIDLQEIPDWNCCGATSGHATNHELSVALPARNLGIAENMGLDVVAPCAACYNRLKGAEVAMKTKPEVAEKVNSAIQAKYSGAISVRPLVDPLSTPEVLDALAARVRRPLSGLKVAAYYGCLLVRPPKMVGFDDPEEPESIDNILKALGADPVEWHYKNECCGASFALTRVDLVHKMTRDILYRAKKAGADAIACACPLCQANLDMRQEEISKKYGESYNIPVFFITELMALAMELPDIRSYLGRHLVDCSPALAKIGSRPTSTTSACG